MRSSTLMPDGRVVFKAHVAHPEARTTYQWECHCHPDDRHDHEAVLSKLGAGLAARDRHIDGLWSLVGWRGRVGLATYEIVDCNLQIHGPALWRLYVAWNAQLLGHPETRREWFQVDYEDPTHCLRPDAILAKVEALELASAERWVRTLRAAGDWLA